MMLDINRAVTVFVVGKSRMIREAFCRSFRDIDPALSFFSVASVEDIAAPDPMPHDTVAAVYAGGETLHSDWVGRQLELCAGAGLGTAIIAESTNLADVTESIRLGCHGFVSADSSFAVAVSAFKIIAAGELFVPAEIVKNTPQHAIRLDSRFRLPAAAGAPAQQSRGWGAVSWRERMVLDLVCMGMPNKAIGIELGIATSTVKIHVSSIMKKLQVTNRTQLCALFCSTKTGGKGRASHGE
jgi:DNA-binding NarL/FixJ family response regulator